jgi:hypothetical protein
MIQGIAAAARGLDVDRQVVEDLALSDELIEATRAQRCVLVLGPLARWTSGRRQEALGPSRVGAVPND